MSEEIKFNDALIESAKTYMSETGISAEKLGRSIGFSATTITRWLRQEYTGDVQGVEDKIADVLATAEVRDIDRPKPIRNKVASRLRAHLENIRKSGQIAVISGPAGIGKTTGCGLYVTAFPSSIFVTVSTWTRDDKSLIRSIYQKGHIGGWNGQTKLGSHVEKALVGSDRLLLIDNGHKLTTRALGTLFDLKDATRIPIGIIANPEIEARILANDQWSSRIGPHEKLTLGDEDARAVAKRLLAFYAPGALEELTAEAIRCIQTKGHGRRLENQLQMARNLRAGDPKMDWLDAFRDSGMTMVQERAE